MKMKGLFNMKPEIMQIEETIKKGKPIAFISASTSGIDAANKKEGYTEHEITRVSVVVYTVVDSKYIEFARFDEYVQCSQKTLEEAARGGYEAISASGINKDDYLYGRINDGDEVKEILSKNAFDAQLSDFFLYTNCIPKDINDIVFVSDDCDLLKHYLPRSAPKSAKTIKQFDTGHRLYDIKEVAGKFYNQKITNIAAINMNMNESALALDKGTLPKIRFMSEFIQHMGREKGLLESVEDENMRKAFEAEKQVQSEKGKESYKNASIMEKLNFFIEKGSIKPEAVTDRNGNSSLNRLYDIFDGKYKGFTIMHAATTGLDAGNEPIQISVYSYDVDEKGNFTPKVGFTNTIIAGERNILRAKQFIHSPPAGKKSFDAFEYAGMSEESYCKMIENGETREVLSHERVNQKLAKFFDKRPFNEYPIISIGSDIRTSRSYTQEALSKYGNLSAFSAPCIDFMQVIKEYFYLVCTETALKVNAIVPPDSHIDNFKLETIAELNGITETKGSSNKCKIIAGFMASLSQQYLAEYLKEHETAEPDKSDEVFPTAEAKENAVEPDNKEPSASGINTDEMLDRFKKQKHKEIERAKYIQTDIENYHSDTEKANNALLNGVENPSTGDVEVEDEYKDYFSSEDGFSGSEQLIQMLDAGMEEEYYDDDPEEYIDEPEEYADEPEKATEVTDAAEVEEHLFEPEIVAKSNDERSEDDEIKKAASYVVIDDDSETAEQPDIQESKAVEESPEAIQEEPPFSSHEEEEAMTETVKESYDESDEFDLFASLQEDAAEPEEAVEDITNASADEYTSLMNLMQQVALSVQAMNDKVTYMADEIKGLKADINNVSAKQAENEGKINALSDVVSRISELDRGVVKVLTDNESENVDMRNNIKLLKEAANKIQSEQEKMTGQLDNIMDLLDKGRKSPCQVKNN